MKKRAQRRRLASLPVRKDPVRGEVIRTYHLEEIYGYRGQDPRVYYLNPWEFVMFWEVEAVTPPRAVTDGNLSVSVWTGVEVLPGVQAEAGNTTSSMMLVYEIMPTTLGCLIPVHCSKCDTNGCFDAQTDLMCLSQMGLLYQTQHRRTRTEPNSTVSICVLGY